MATYQERLAEARILYPAATSPDDPRVLAAAEARLKTLGYDQALDNLWLGGDAPFNYDDPYYRQLNLACDRAARLVSLADL